MIFPTVVARSACRVGLPLCAMPLSIASGALTEVRLSPWVPLRVSRLRWGAVHGLELRLFSIGTLIVQAAHELNVSLSEPGMWRFPPIGLAPGVDVRIQIYNHAESNVVLRDLTVWGTQVRRPDFFGAFG